MLMILPETCHLSNSLPGNKPHHFHVAQGIGYSRLCSQLVAYGSGLDNIWLMDDNVQQCFELDFVPGLTDNKLFHKPEALKPVTFDVAMQKLEQAVLNQQQWPVRFWKPAVGALFSSGVLDAKGLKSSLSGADV